MSINRVNISGNLSRDPELRMTSGGTQVLSFGVAVNDRRRNPQSGEWEDYPNFVDCTMFGARAEAVSRYLSKGSKVAIEGKLRYSSWERDGQRRSKLKCRLQPFVRVTEGIPTHPRPRAEAMPSSPRRARRRLSRLRRRRISTTRIFRSRGVDAWFARVRSGYAGRAKRKVF